MITSDFTVVSTTYEVTNNGWLYRIIEDKRGCFVKRVKSDNVLWNHGVLVQHVDKDTKKFLPANVSGLPMFFSKLSDAAYFIYLYQE